MTDITYQSHPQPMETAQFQPQPPADGIPPLNCWLDDDWPWPSPCVFDDPGETINNCTFAVMLKSTCKSKTDCKHYRITQPEPPENGDAAELAAEIRHFLAGYRKMRGLHPEHIYSIHQGHEMEAHITVSKLTRIAELLEQLNQPKPEPHQPPAAGEGEALAARPLLERVAQMSDCIGQHTVAEIMEISKRAAHWLAENSPGQPVAIEPRGCPTPGACSCVQPASTPPADSEVAELVAWLQEEAARLDPHNYDTFHVSSEASKLTRIAELLKNLELVAYAASDFICGTRFPQFANEHGGIDRLMADLCRLVAQFEHGPRPVPGVDVPGPDGDWGGFAELCNAEGVDLRIGVPLLQRAKVTWRVAVGPSDGELNTLWNCCGVADEYGHHEGNIFEFARAVLARWGRSTPQPIPVIERPWEREGWCDAEGRCWMQGTIEGEWRLLNPVDCGLPHPKYCFSRSLPAHALLLPLPSGEVQE